MYSTWLQTTYANLDYGWTNKPNRSRRGSTKRSMANPLAFSGFGLFPNPEFNAEARKKWDGNRYMNDPKYYSDNQLIRPYRVGISCGSCHIAPLPTNPPADPENPRWENLASAIGNQYIREGKVFACNVEKGGFFYEMLQAQPPGTSDTSRIATDHINNPNAINAIFLLAERERIALPEKLAGGTLRFPAESQRCQSPRILKDGADSIGVPGATIRVYINIGMFSEYWLTRHNRLDRPGPAEALRDSVRARAFHLLAGDRGTARQYRCVLPETATLSSGRRSRRQRLHHHRRGAMTRGRQVFGESCASCHSSKQPPAGIDPHSGEGKEWFRAEVHETRFSGEQFPLQRRALSAHQDRRPTPPVRSGPMPKPATSGITSPRKPTRNFRRSMNLSSTIHWTKRSRSNSDRRRRTPAPVIIAFHHSLVSGVRRRFCTTTRLVNFNGDPSVEGRLHAFNDAAEKLLWPEKRLGKASIWRTENECYIHLRKEFVPKALQRFADNEGYVKVGPDPQRTRRSISLPISNPGSRSNWPALQAEARDQR